MQDHSTSYDDDRASQGQRDINRSGPARCTPGGVAGQDRRLMMDRCTRQLAAIRRRPVPCPSAPGSRHGAGDPAIGDSSQSRVLSFLGPGRSCRPFSLLAFVHDDLSRQSLSYYL